MAEAMAWLKNSGEIGGWVSCVEVPVDVDGAFTTNKEERWCI